ncbi:MAG: hypothetical protein NVS3B17_15830 [Vulcanimicrobiaceae bacterium]
MSDSNAQLRAELEVTRRRAAASAEAVSYRTDVPKRAKDAVEQGKNRFLTSIVTSLDMMKDSVGKAASTAQAGASDLTERARPHVEAAIDTVGAAAEAAIDTVGAAAETASVHIADVAHKAAEQLAPIGDGVSAAAETVASAAQSVAAVASDAIDAGKESLASSHATPPRDTPRTTTGI